MQALRGGHARADLNTFYHLARCLLVKRESEYDNYDRAFASFFGGIEATPDVSEELLEWLENPVLPDISDEDREKMRAFDLDELAARFRELLEEQKDATTAATAGLAPAARPPSATAANIPRACASSVAGVEGQRCKSPTPGGIAICVRDRILDTRQIGSGAAPLEAAG